MMTRVESAAMAKLKQEHEAELAALIIAHGWEQIGGPPRIRVTFNDLARAQGKRVRRKQEPGVGYYYEVAGES